VTSPRNTELIRLAAITLVSAAAGLLSGHPVPLLLAGAIVYLGWHFRQLLRLSRLLRENRPLRPPFPGGLWRGIFERIRQLQAKSRKRKRRLVRYFSRFREAAAALPDATVILGDQGHIEWCNPAARALLGLEWPQAAGKDFGRLMQHPVLADYLSKGDYGRPLELTSPVDKTKVLSLMITSFGRSRRQHLVVARDITRLYHLDRARRDFVANVSHELRTPLTVVSGFLETMEEDERMAETWGNSISLMRQQAKRMADTINDLLVLSRLEMNEEEPAGEPVAVARLLAGIAEEAGVLSGQARHRISLDADPGLLLKGDEKELRAAFSNLVFNAVRHTPGGSEIRIRWEADGRGAVFSVSDTGEGIPARHIPRLTERFYRVDAARSRESGGTGLGLAIVKHVLNRHGSKLQITSKEGKGSTFSCRFPPARTGRAPGPGNGA